MADNFEGNEFDENGDGANGEKGPKALREAYDKQKAQNEALAKELAELRAKDRRREIETSLSEKGINAKVAKFIPADAVLDDWLKENGELFGVTGPDGEPKTQTAEQAPAAQAAPHPLQAQFGQLASAAEGAKAPTGTVDQAKAAEALQTGGLEGFEAYIRSHATQR